VYKVNKVNIEGLIELIPNIFTDHRGESIKPYHSETLKELGIQCDFNEDLMVTSNKGVLRGLHLQKPPYEQAKLIYCVKGSIFDVAVDIRKQSLTYGQYVYFNIDAKKHNIVYIPTGFAHGYLVMEDDTTVIYKMSSIYSPDYENGIKWDSIDIPWPIKEPILSEKDKGLSSFNSFNSGF
jgi:dTDP-4-dehydrorhamnose 3,5-epimerase